MALFLDVIEPLKIHQAVVVSKEAALRADYLFIAQVPALLRHAEIQLIAFVTARVLGNHVLTYIINP